MGRQLIIDMDTHDMDTIGEVTLEDLMLLHTSCLAGVLTAIGQNVGWQFAEAMGSEICAQIGKYLDQQKP